MTHIQFPLPSVLLGGILLVNCIGCATILRPKGEWTRPVELNLTKGVLAESRIALECGQRNLTSQAWQPTGGRMCSWMQRALKPTGADVRILDEVEAQGEGLSFDEFDDSLPEARSSDAEEGKGNSNTDGVSKVWQPDFTMRFVSVDSKRTVQWGMELMFITMSFIPFTVVTETSAEVQILDEVGRLHYRDLLRIDEIQAYGLGAILYYLSPRENNHTKMASVLTKHLQNMAYSYQLISDRKKVRSRAVVDKR